jgi:hypothetical protein
MLLRKRRQLFSDRSSTVRALTSHRREARKIPSAATAKMTSR